MRRCFRRKCRLNAGLLSNFSPLHTRHVQMLFVVSPNGTGCTMLHTFGSKFSSSKVNNSLRSAIEFTSNTCVVEYIYIIIIYIYLHCFLHDGLGTKLMTQLSLSPGVALRLRLQPLCWHIIVVVGLYVIYVDGRGPALCILLYQVIHCPKLLNH